MRWVWIGVVVSTIAAVFVGIVLISKAETRSLSEKQCSKL